MLPREGRVAAWFLDQVAKNKGYYTPEHLEALARYGPCPEHRKTFHPVKSYFLPLFPFQGEA